MSCRNQTGSDRERRATSSDRSAKMRPWRESSCAPTWVCLWCKESRSLPVRPVKSSVGPPPEANPPWLGLALKRIIQIELKTKFGCLVDIAEQRNHVTGSDHMTPPPVEAVRSDSVLVSGHVPVCVLRVIMSGPHPGRHL